MKRSAGAGDPLAAQQVAWGGLGMMVRPVVVLMAALCALAACTSPGSLLDASGLLPPKPVGTASAAADPAGSGQTAGEAEGDGGQIASVRSGTRVEFAPVIGADPGAVQPLSQRLVGRAAALGLELGTSADGISYILKGYLAVEFYQGRTIVHYVWDVLDPSGTRLHRIQGEQAQKGGDGGWSSVSSATMQAVADSTIDELSGWIAARKG